MGARVLHTPHSMGFISSTLANSGRAATLRAAGEKQELPESNPPHPAKGGATLSSRRAEQVQELAARRAVWINRISIGIPALGRRKARQHQKQFHSCFSITIPL